MPDSDNKNDASGDKSAERLTKAARKRDKQKRVDAKTLAEELPSKNDADDELPVGNKVLDLTPVASNTSGSESQSTPRSKNNSTPLLLSWDLSRLPPVSHIQRWPTTC